MEIFIISVLCWFPKCVSGKDFITSHGKSQKNLAFEFFSDFIFSLPYFSIFELRWSKIHSLTTIVSIFINPLPLFNSALLEEKLLLDVNAMIIVKSQCSNSRIQKNILEWTLEWTKCLPNCFWLGPFCKNWKTKHRGRLSSCLLSVTQ